MHLLETRSMTEIPSLNATSHFLQYYFYIYFFLFFHVIIFLFIIYYLHLLFSLNGKNMSHGDRFPPPKQKFVLELRTEIVTVCTSPESLIILKQAVNKVSHNS